MATSENSGDAPLSDSDFGEDVTAPSRRSMRSLASELWHQKPGARAVKEPKPLPPGTKEIVNGLEQRELVLGIGLCVVDLALSLLTYYYARHDATLRIRQDASTYLIAGLIGTALLVGGVAFRRRALLGFAAFLVGMEQLTSGDLYGAVLFLFYGGWLIFRVMRKQKQDQAAGRFTGTVDTGPRGATAKLTASKRYTPPRRAAAKSATSRRR